MAMRDKIEHLLTFIIAVGLIFAAMPLVVKVNNEAFTVFVALLIGFWLWCMYRRFL
jgi:hypothetical protein